MCTSDFSIFHAWGKLVKFRPEPILGLWVITLIVGIYLMPIRMEAADDVIEMWLPLDGKAVHSKKFFNDIYKHNKWYNEYPDLEDRADDEFWWRNNRKYFHVWGSDKSKRGNVIYDHNHFSEWYDLDKQLLDAQFEVLGENRTWQDLCAYDYDTNAYNTDQAVNDEYDGSYWFHGYSTGWWAAQGTGPSTSGVAGGFWSSAFADVDNGNIDPTWWFLHSQFLAQTAGPGVYGIVSASPFAVSPGTSQAGFNTNCGILLGLKAAFDTTSPSGQALNGLLTGYWNTDVWDANQKSMFCGQQVFYATIKDGGFVYKMTCSVLDIAFCVQEDAAEYFGTLFAPPLTASVYPGGMYENQTTRDMWAPDWTDSNSEAEFLSALGSCPILGYILETQGQKYIRTSKYVAFPVELARRLQILDGNCTLKHPSIEQTQTGWTNAYNESVTLERVQNEVPGALAILTKCQEFSTYYAQCVASGNSTGPGCAETGQAVVDLATLSGGTITDGASAGAFCTTEADATIEGSSREILTTVTTAVGVNVFKYFLLDYRSKMWYECPDFDDESIREAKDLGETVVDKFREIIDDFNVDSTYMEISILSDGTEKEGYENLFQTNASFMIISVCIMIVFVVGANYKNFLITVFSMVLTLMCIAAVFGFTLQPYTPSMIQFLPYLLLGIGVDDLFVILSHYNDEGTVARAINHAGQAITCTSLTNFCVFLTLYLLAQVPDVQQFTFAAMLGVAFLYINVFCGILPVMTLIRWGKGEEDVINDTDDLAHLGVYSMKTYLWLKEKVDAVRNIGCPICIVLIWITLTILAFGKIEGFVGDKMALGLKISELVEKDEGDHLYRSLKIFEDFPFYGIDCGSGNEHGTSNFLGHVFDDDWPRLKAFFNDLNTIQYTSITSTSWANAITETKPQPYPYYTNQAQQPLPAYWNNWYDQDHILEPTNLTVPLAAFVSVPPEASGRYIVSVIEDMYDVIDDYEDIGAWCNSVTLQVFERYIGVEQVMYMSLVVTVSLIFLVSLLLVGDVGASIIMSIVCALTAFQLWGFFGYAGLQMNNVLTLNIMLGAAFMVQYTAHLAHRFVISPAPTRWHRVIDSISVYGWPLVLGAASTAIAVSVAAFYPIKYFNLYFFRAFMLVVGFGLWNGFFVQSALLILIPVWSSWGVPMGVFGEDNDNGKLERRYSDRSGGIELPGIQTIQSESSDPKADL